VAEVGCQTTIAAMTLPDVTLLVIAAPTDVAQALLDLDWTKAVAAWAIGKLFTGQLPNIDKTKQVIATLARIWLYFCEFRILFRSQVTFLY
jgi:hypothetical protein